MKVAGRLSFCSLFVPIMVSIMISPPRIYAAGAPAKAAAGQPAESTELKQGKEGQSPKFHGSFIEKLAHAPYPYTGKYADTNIDFLDYIDPFTRERFHTTRYGNRFPEKIHYSDNRVLFHIPPSFKPKKPFVFVVFFHGHETEIESFASDYLLCRQIDDSGKNAILVIPQLARKAADSSPGKFFRKNEFNNFMREASNVLSRKLGSKYSKRLKTAPIILAAFSGGYKAAAFVLDRGKVDNRIKGIMLLDALYDDLEMYGKWIRKHARSSFFINIYTDGSTGRNSEILKTYLLQCRLRPKTEWPQKSLRSEIYFIKSSEEHLKIPVAGPPESPLAELLRRFKP